MLLNWTHKDIVTNTDATDMVCLYKQVQPIYGAFDTETTGLHIKLDKPFLFQFGFADLKNNKGYTFAVDIERQPKLSQQVISRWNLLAQQLTLYAGANVKFDLHMLDNIDLPYEKNNITDIQIFIRMAHDALTPANGGPPLGLKEYASQYIDRTAKQHEQLLKQEKTVIASQLNQMLLCRLKKCPLLPGIKSYTKKVLSDLFKDPIMDQSDLPEEIKEAYMDWLQQDVPIYLQQKITGLVESDMIPYHKLNRTNLRHYAHMDIVFTLEILLKLLPTVEARKNVQGLQLENRLIFPFYEMERTGFLVDKAYLLQAQQKLKQYIQERRQKLYNMSGNQFAIGQHNVIKKLLNNHYNVFVQQTGKEVLNTVKSDLIQNNENPEAVEFINLVQELRTLEKWYSVYIMRFVRDLQNTDRLYTQINQVGTVSGRVTSDFQQFPKAGIVDDKGNELFNPRKMVIPTQKALAYLDYSQIELRFQAFYTILVQHPDLNLCRAYMPFECVNAKGVPFNYKNLEHIKKWHEDWYLKENPTIQWTPVDVHGATTEKATGLTPADPEFASLRSKIGKRVNFAKNYGAKYNKIKEMFPDKSEEEIRRIDNAYYAAFPGVKAYHTYCYQRAISTACTPNLFGVKYYNVSGHKLINMLIQGSAAYYLKLKIIQLYEYMKQNNLKSKLQMQIHDELCWELAEGEEQHLINFKHIMEDWDETYVPIVADLEITKTTWADKHEVESLEDLNK